MEQKVKRYFIGKNEVFIDKENIINVLSIGDINEQLCIDARKIILNLLDIASKYSDEKIRFLIDINRSKRPCPVFKKFLISELYKKKLVGKTAVYGMHPVAKVIFSFITGLSNKKDIKFFNTREESIAWLRRKD